MKLVLCPRCELNYITGNEQYCKVCMQEMRGVRRPEEQELCTICNENPVIPGRDICAACLHEMDVSAGTAADHQESDPTTDAGEIVEMDSVAQMDEILPVMKDDMDSEYGSVEHALSLEAVREDEEKEQEEAEQGNEN